jgi:hypothetical protein
LVTALKTLGGLIEEFRRLAGFEAEGCAVTADDLKR